MENKVSDLDYSGHKIFIGLDVHLKEWKATIMLEETPFKTFSLDPNAVTLKRYLEKHFPGGEYFSAYEAGFSGFSTHRSLSGNGIKNVVANPADIPTTDKERKQKEDKRDSRKIANSLKNEQLLPIYIPKVEMEELRNLVRYRKTLVKEISRNKSRVKSFLYLNGIEIPPALSAASTHWSTNFTKWLQTVRLTTDYGHLVLLKTLETVSQLRTALLSMTKDLKRIISSDSNLKQKASNLMSIPGIGFVMAITLLTEIGDINRFKHIDQLCSFTGLVPSTKSSGETERTGGITKRSNNLLREILVECAWISIRNDSSMTLPYINLCKKMNSNKAIIRIAKKLLIRIRYVLKNNTKYEIRTA
jgi:transposase